MKQQARLQTITHLRLQIIQSYVLVEAIRSKGGRSMRVPAGLLGLLAAVQWAQPASSEITLDVSNLGEAPVPLRGAFDSKLLRFNEPCVTADKTNTDFKGANIRYVTDIDELTAQSELAKRSALSLSGSASYGFGRFAGSLYSKETSSDSISKYKKTFLGTVRVVFPYVSLTSVKLTERGEKYAGNAELFRKHCGDHFVYGAYFGASANLKITYDLDVSEKSVVVGQGAAAKIDAKFIKAAIEVGSEHDKRELRSQKNISLSATITGGTGEGLEKMRDLEEYIRTGFIKDVRSGSPRPWAVRVVMRPYESIDGFKIRDDYSAGVSEREKQLVALYDEQVGLNVYKNTLNRSLTDRANATIHIPKDSEDAARARITKIDARVAEITKIVGECKTAVEKGNVADQQDDDKRAEILKAIDLLCSREALSTTSPLATQTAAFRAELPTGFCRRVSFVTGHCLRCELGYHAPQINELTQRDRLPLEHEAWYEGCEKFAPGKVRVQAIGALRSYYSKPTPQGSAAQYYTHDVRLLLKFFHIESNAALKDRKPAPCSNDKDAECLPGQLVLRAFSKFAGAVYAWLPAQHLEPQKEPKNDVTIDFEKGDLKLKLVPDRCTAIAGDNTHSGDEKNCYFNGTIVLEHISAPPAR